MLCGELGGPTGLTASHRGHRYALLQGKNTGRNQPEEETHRADCGRARNARLLGPLSPWSPDTSPSQQGCGTTHMDYGQPQEPL